MQTKRTVKIVFLSIISISVLIVGYFMFQRLTYNKEVFETDIRSHVPKTATSVIQVNRATKDIPIFLDKLNSTISKLGEVEIFPVYIISNSNGTAVLFKVNKEQEIRIREVLKKKIYPSFPAKERDYKGTIINFYSSDNNTFFASIFHSGIFACSYNYKLLEDIIDTKPNQNFFADKNFKELNGKYSDSYTANLFIRKDKVRACYNYTKTGDIIQFEGYVIPSSVIANNVCQSDKHSNTLNFDRKIITNTVAAFEIQINTNNVMDSLACEFTPPMYQLYLSSDSDTPVYALKFNRSRFKVFDMMQKLEKQLSGKRLIEHGRIKNTKYNLYSGSSEFSEQFFKCNEIVYFSYKENYLTFSTNKEMLEVYLASAKDISENEKLNFPSIDTTSNMFYYSNGRTFNHQYLFLKETNIIRDTASVITIQTMPDVECLKVKIQIK